MFGNTAMFSI